MEQEWQKILKKSITTVKELADRFPDVPGGLHEVAAKYPVKINPYYLSLMKTHDDPVALQAVPSAEELGGVHGHEDPLAELHLSCVDNLIHRYPDRVVLLASRDCAVYCRFCMRKRNTGRTGGLTPNSFKDAVAYIREDHRIKEVILSGGDPFLLADDRIEHLLSEIRRIAHVGMIRIHSRVMCTLPQRITQALAGILAKYHPVCVNTHFNHPAELTAQAEKSLKILAGNGIMLGCQTVLLKGVNNDPKVLENLFRKLVCAGVRPYYLHHPDLVKGTGHFYCSLDQGISIMNSLRGFISGMCIPDYVVDLPGGAGKVSALPSRLCGADEKEYVFENHKGSLIRYPCL